MIERVSADLERDLEDPAYGVGALVDPTEPPSADSALRETITNALGGIIAALGSKKLGI